MRRDGYDVQKVRVVQKCTVPNLQTLPILIGDGCFKFQLYPIQVDYMYLALRAPKVYKYKFRSKLRFGK